MHPLLRLTLRLAMVFVICFVAIQPFNWFCKLTNKCEPFYFSYHFLKPEGSREIQVNFGAMNYREDLEFTVDESSLTTVSNRMNIVTYRARNLSKRMIRFRPIMHIDPESSQRFIISYECPCSHEFKLKQGEEIELKMKFRIDDKIYNALDERDRDQIKIKIIYRIK